jgi:hypothetical protein
MATGNLLKTEGRGERNTVLTMADESRRDKATTGRLMSGFFSFRKRKASGKKPKQGNAVTMQYFQKIRQTRHVEPVKRQPWASQGKAQTDALMDGVKAKPLTATGHHHVSFSSSNSHPPPGSGIAPSLKPVLGTAL